MARPRGAGAGPAREAALILPLPQGRKPTPQPSFISKHTETFHRRPNVPLMVGGGCALVCLMAGESLLRAGILELLIFSRKIKMGCVGTAGMLHSEGQRLPPGPEAPQQGEGAVGWELRRPDAAPTERHTGRRCWTLLGPSPTAGPPVLLGLALAARPTPGRKQAGGGVGRVFLHCPGCPRGCRPTQPHQKPQSPAPAGLLSLSTQG